MAEGEGFEPSTPVTQGKHLAGARTRPLCDPSIVPTKLIIFDFAYFYNTHDETGKPFPTLMMRVIFMRSLQNYFSAIPYNTGEVKICSMITPLPSTLLRNF